MNIEQVIGTGRNKMIDELSDCCNALIRYLDCEDCRKAGEECIWICTECGREILKNNTEK